MQGPEFPSQKTLTAEHHRDRLLDLYKYKDEVPLERIQAKAGGVKYKAADSFFVSVRNLLDEIVISQPEWLSQTGKEQLISWSEEITKMLEETKIRSYERASQEGEEKLLPLGLTPELVAEIEQKTRMELDKHLKLSEIPHIVINAFPKDKRYLASIYFLHHHPLTSRMPKQGRVPEDLRALRLEQIQRLNEIILNAIRILGKEKAKS